jgi:hypothetical protein
MKAAEIIAELSKLTTEERSAVRQRLRELDEKDESQFLVESAEVMFQHMDKDEEEHAKRKAR